MADDTFVKKCTRCNVEKASTEFYADRGTRDGRACRCKVCASEQTKARYRALPADVRYLGKRARKKLIKAGIVTPAKRGPSPKRNLAPPLEKCCTRCGELKPRSGYHLQRASVLTARCIQCTKEVRLEREYGKTPTDAQKKARRESSLRWARKNPDHWVKWRANNQERVKALGVARESRRRARLLICVNTLTCDELTQIAKIQKFKCAICKVSVKKKRHADHIVPLARGGDNTRRNIQMLCPSCNRSKWARDPIDYMQSLGLLL